MKESFKQLFLYLFVGAFATIVEWVGFYFLDTICSLHYAIATTLAFIVSTFANWGCGKIVMFHEKQNLLKELGKIYLTSVLGLLLNLLIMWVAIERIGINEMVSKIIATGLVFFWNFLVRKLVIYKI